jgi:hypothetical protein
MMVLHPAATAQGAVEAAEVDAADSGAAAAVDSEAEGEASQVPKARATTCRSQPRSQTCSIM